MSHPHVLESAARIYYSRGTIIDGLVNNKLGVTHGYLVDYIRDNILQLREAKMATVDTRMQVMGKSLAQIAAHMKPRRSNILRGLRVSVVEGGVYDAQSNTGGYYDPSDFKLFVSFYVLHPRASLYIRPRQSTAVIGRRENLGGYVFDPLKSIAVLDKSYPDRLCGPLSLTYIIVDVAVPIFPHNRQGTPHYVVARKFKKIFEALERRGAAYSDYFHQYFNWRRRAITRKATLLFELPENEAIRILLEELGLNPPEKVYTRVRTDAHPRIGRTTVSLSTESNRLQLKMVFEFGIPSIGLRMLSPQARIDVWGMVGRDPIIQEEMTVAQMLHDPNHLVFIYDGTASVVYKDHWEPLLDDYLLFRCFKADSSQAPQNIDRSRGFFDMHTLGLEHHVYVTEHDLKAAFNYEGRLKVFEIYDEDQPLQIVSIIRRDTLDNGGDVTSRTVCGPGKAGKVRRIRALV